MTGAGYAVGTDAGDTEGTMKNGLRRSIGLVAVAAILLPLAACGVKSTPQAPEGSTYPQQYPKALPPLEAKEPDAKQVQPAVTDPNSFYQYPNRPPAQ